MARTIQEALREANQNVVPATPEPTTPVDAGANPDTEIERITSDDDTAKTPYDNATDITVLGGAIKLQNVVMAQLQERITALEQFLAQLIDTAGGEETEAPAEDEDVPGTEPIE